MRAKPGLLEADKLADSNSVGFALAMIPQGPQSAASCVPPPPEISGSASRQA